MAGKAREFSMKQQQDLQKEILKGSTPTEIAKALEVSVSTVHNYKRKMRQAGMNVPSMNRSNFVPTLQPATTDINIMNESQKHFARSRSTVSVDRPSDIEALKKSVQETGLPSIHFIKMTVNGVDMEFKARKFFINSCSVSIIF